MWPLRPNGRQAKARGAFPRASELPLPDADYNVAPTTHQPIIRQSRETGERELILARWGLVPFFTKDLKDIKGLSTINARSETITKVPTWREPFKKRRCLMPVNGEKRPNPEAALCLRAGKRWRLRLCGPVGRLEGQGRPLAPVVRSRDDGGQLGSAPDPTTHIGASSRAGL